MNVLSIQYCGLALITLIFILSIRHITLPIKSYKIYFLAATNALICLVLDVLSLYAILNRQSLGNFITMLVCRLYIISLAEEAYCALHYVLSTTLHKKRSHIFKYAFLSANILSVILMLTLPIYINDKKVSEMSTFGPATTVTYTACVIFIVSTILICIIYRKYISKRRFYTVIQWMCLWFGSAAFQFFTNSVQIVAFAMALGVLMLFTEVENPDSYLDRDTGLMNSHALSVWLGQNLNTDRTYSAFELIIKNESEYIYNEDLHKAISIFMGKYLSRFKSAMIFKDTTFDFTLIFKNEEEMRLTLESVKDKLDKTFVVADVEIKLDAAFLMLSDIGVVDVPNQFFQLHNWYLHEHPDMIIATIGDNEIIEERNKQNICDMVARAMRENRLEVFYQPVYNVEANSYTMSEALVRIRDIDGYVIYPSSFIPIIEKNNLIEKLGEAIFENVCRFISESNIKELGVRLIEVNLSARQCSQPDLAKKFIKIMKRYNVDPSLIGLEITESTSITSRSTLLSNMKQLMDKGIHFALDDFGTGRSNINYIINLPVDVVKFDKELTQSYFTNEKSHYIMENIIRLVRQLGLTIITEGVETREQYLTLKDLGIKHIQGFYFSKPLPAEDYITFLKEKNV